MNAGLDRLRNIKFTFTRYFGRSIVIILLSALISGCDWGPREKEIARPGFHGSTHAEDTGLYFDLHRVKLKEILPTDSYVYLKVTEGNKDFWIAARPSDYEVDSFYYYQEALLKKDFESKQLNKAFDSIYLVTKLVPELHHLGSENTARPPD